MTDTFGHRETDTQCILCLLCGKKKANLIEERSDFEVTEDREGQRGGENNMVRQKTLDLVVLNTLV